MFKLSKLVLICCLLFFNNIKLCISSNIEFILDLDKKFFLNNIFCLDLSHSYLLPNSKASAALKPTTDLSI